MGDQKGNCHCEDMLNIQEPRQFKSWTYQQNLIVWSNRLLKYRLLFLDVKFITFNASARTLTASTPSAITTPPPDTITGFLAEASNSAAC